jgi:hypothetical protein
MVDTPPCASVHELLPAEIAGRPKVSTYVRWSTDREEHQRIGSNKPAERQLGVGHASGVGWPSEAVKDSPQYWQMPQQIPLVWA